MKQHWKAKFLFHLADAKALDKKEQGFTLIELLVVVILIGVLSAIALPNFIRQAAKAREVEMKNAVGTINRSQQAYHWEKQVFAGVATPDATTDAAALTTLGIGFDNQYIDIYNIIGGVPEAATVTPVNNEIEADQTRAYSGGTFYVSGGYNTIICQSYEVVASIAAPTDATTCPTDSIELK